MLDINKLVGFVYHTKTPGLFRSIKQSLLEISSTFEVDDAAIVMESYNQGSGAITGAIANSKRLATEEDFIDTVKAVVKSIGEADLNSPKSIFIISDVYSDEMELTISKLRKLVTNYDYPPQLKFIQLSQTAKCYNPQAQRTIVNDVDSMLSEIKIVLEQLNDIR